MSRQGQVGVVCEGGGRLWGWVSQGGAFRALTVSQLHILPCSLPLLPPIPSSLPATHTSSLTVHPCPPLCVSPPARRSAAGSSGGSGAPGFNVPKRELGFVVLFIICGGLIAYRWGGTSQQGLNTHTHSHKPLISRATLLLCGVEWGVGGVPCLPGECPAQESSALLPQTC